MANQTSNPPDTLPEDLICACTGLRLEAFRDQLQSNPDLSFEEILHKTGAGGDCTACLLDLEYFFVSTPRTGARTTRSTSASMKPERSLKRKIFDFIDDHSPLVPITLKNRFPLVAGSDLEQRVWVSNRSLLFEGERTAPPFKVALVVRDENGKICHRENRTIDSEDALEMSVSQYISPPASNDAPLSIGSVEVIRKGTKQGFRGTTRPQTEILAPDGTCSVHGQDYKYPGERWFSCIYQPKDQRVFLSFINFSSSVNRVGLSYPMNVTALGIDPRQTKLEIEPHGAVIHEVLISDDEAEKISGRLVAFKWSCSAEYNCHIFCATPNLDRLSIDHS